MEAPIPSLHDEYIEYLAVKVSSVCAWRRIRHHDEIHLTFHVILSIASRDFQIHTCPQVFGYP